ncbi:MAG: glucose-1-phosphate thymidylyltransferase [Candidatus Pacebacteria bacterium]|nr:glucose-1-phosphate thymidylyltransferase [Candidatus Paceibacterota bacterium]
MEIKHIATPIKGLNLYLNKVVSDPRGSYCDMAPGGTDNPLYADGIKHIHASIATHKFVPRGGHYHFRLKENFFTLSGTALWYFYDFDKNSPTYGQGYSVVLGYDKLGLDLGIPEYTIDRGAAAQIMISPGVYHVYFPLTDAETVVAGTGSLDYDAEDYDRTKVEDVPGAMESFERVKAALLKIESKGEAEERMESIMEQEKPAKITQKIKAIIPAAKNNQQRPFSYNMNKHLIPLGGRPMIFYPIESLVDAGFSEIGIIVGERDSDLRKVVGDGSRWGITIEYIVQKELMGLGSAVMSAKEYVGEDPFIVYLGDNVAKCDLISIINRYFDEKMNAMLMLAKVNKPQRFGVPEIQNGEIVRVEERPMHPRSEFAVAGIYIYDSNAFRAMEEIDLSDRGQYEISDIHNYYINSDLKLGFEEISKWWKDRGNPEDLLEGNKFILENFVFAKGENRIDGEVIGNAKIDGRVVIGRGSRVTGKSLLRGPLVIGEGCLIKDSYVGPYTSIGSGSEINNTEIEHSLIMNGVNIYTDKKIVNSIIGNNVSITSGEDNLPKGKQVIVGENSSIKW